MPLEPYHKHLLIIEDDKGRRQITLERPQYSIGRDQECDIRLVSLFVSRHHATLVQITDGNGQCGYRILDGTPTGQRSSNGILVNGRRLQSHELQDEDVVVFGPQVRFTYFLLKRDPDSTEPVDEFDITLINPRTAGKQQDKSDICVEYIDQRPLSPSHTCNLWGRRRWRLLNFKWLSSLKPEHRSKLLPAHHASDS